MAHINEIRCFGCHKRIGTYIDGDTKGAEVVLRSLQEHEMHWCPAAAGYHAKDEEQ